MGQAMTCETLCIHGEDGYKYWVGLQAKPYHRGYKKTTYKGVLLGQGARRWEKVAVRAFTNLPNTRENWQHEINKAKVTREMVAKFREAFPEEPNIIVILPCPVQMDKVSKVNQWLERRHGFTILSKEDWVSVEEHNTERVHHYCSLSRLPSWDDMDTMESEHLSTLSHFTYLLSEGQLVICDVQASVGLQERYVISDVVVHSRDKTFGSFDHGEDGIINFFRWHKCSHLCKDWPRPSDLIDSAQPSVELVGDEELSDVKRKVHFNLNIEKFVFKRGSFKNSLSTLRRHASDEGAKLRNKWMGRLTKSSQLLPLAHKEGPPPYDDIHSSEIVAAPSARVKSWTISECSIPSTPPPHMRARDTYQPVKSCLKRSASDQQVSKTFKDL